MILIEKAGKITAGSLKDWTIRVQDDKGNTDGFLIILTKNEEQYDEWASDFENLKKLFVKRAWEVAWEE
jgi:hypothetical protein